MCLFGYSALFSFVRFGCTCLTLLLVCWQYCLVCCFLGCFVWGILFWFVVGSVCYLWIFVWWFVIIVFVFIDCWFFGVGLRFGFIFAVFEFGFVGFELVLVGLVLTICLFFGWVCICCLDLLLLGAGCLGIVYDCIATWGWCFLFGLVFAVCWLGLMMVLC